MPDANITGNRNAGSGAAGPVKNFCLSRKKSLAQALQNVY